MKELEKQIEKLKKQIEKTREAKQKSVEKYDNKIKELSEELWPLCKEYNQMLIEHWKERGEQGLNKNINFSDIPDAIKGVRRIIFDKVSGGCTGDWYDGCRGCLKDCARKADQEWLEMFNMTYHY